MTPEQAQVELDYYDDSQVPPEVPPLPDDLRVLAGGAAGDEDDIPW